MRVLGEVRYPLKAHIPDRLSGLDDLLSVPVRNRDGVPLVRSEEVNVAHPHRLADVIFQEHAVGCELDLVVVEVRVAVFSLDGSQSRLVLQKVDLSVKPELLRSQVYLPIPAPSSALVRVLRSAVCQVVIQTLGVVEDQVVEAPRAVEVLVEVGDVDEVEVLLNHHRTPWPLRIEAQLCRSIG